MRWLAVCAVALVATLAAAVPGAFAGPPVETAYVGQLRAASDEAAAAAAEVSGLSAGDSEQLKASGQRLLGAIGEAKRVLRTYRDAQMRHGTDEEYTRVKAMLASSRSGLASFGQLAGEPQKVKRRDRSFAQQQLRALLTDKLAARAARSEVGRWLGDEAIREVLNANGLRDAKSTLGLAVEARLRSQANTLVKQTLRVGLDVGAPLGPQLKRLRAELANRARQAAIDWLARAVFKTSPSGIVMEFVGRPIVRFLERQLREAFRGKGKLRSRTERTLKGFEKHHSILENSKDDDRIAVVERRIARAQNALAATGFLKKDLRRAARARRCRSNRANVRKSCEAARGHLRALKEAESGPNGLETWIAMTRERFLLDSKLANADFNAWIDELKRAERQLRRMLKNLPKPPSCAVWTGAWNRVEHAGTLTLTQSGFTVNGSYDWSGGGTFSGKLQPDGTLTGDFNDEVGTGTFTLSLFSDGDSFSGTFEGKTPTGTPLAGSFGGTREGENPCR